MRAYLTTFYLCAALVLPAAAAPSVQELLKAEAAANAACRGSTEPESIQTQEECDRRDRLVGRLSQEGMCYGRQGEVGAQMRWHRCGPGSLTINDLRPSAIK